VLTINLFAVQPHVSEHSAQLTADMVALIAKADFAILSTVSRVSGPCQGSSSYIIHAAALRPTIIMKHRIAFSDTDSLLVLTAAVQNDTRYGIDVSHRGGLPGFMAIVDDHTLLLPDYAGTSLISSDSCVLHDIQSQRGTYTDVVDGAYGVLVL